MLPEIQVAAKPAKPQRRRAPRKQPEPAAS
jgi:hypothetical protein